MEGTRSLHCCLGKGLPVIVLDQATHHLEWIFLLLLLKNDPNHSDFYHGFISYRGHDMSVKESLKQLDTSYKLRGLTRPLGRGSSFK